MISYLLTSRSPHKNSYWSKLNGDGNITWGPDALLTPLGETQAAGARTAWKKELADGVPLPTKFLSSPLRRALDTWKITFAEAPAGEKPVLSSHQRNALIYEVSFSLFSQVEVKLSYHFVERPRNVWYTHLRHAFQQIHPSPFVPSADVHFRSTFP